MERSPEKTQRISVLVKFQQDLLVRIEDFAKTEGVDRMAAIITLAERGLQEPVLPIVQLPPSSSMAKAAPRARLPAPAEIEPDVAAHIERLRELHEPRRSLAMPLDALTGKPLPARKAFNPQPKKGKK